MFKQMYSHPSLNSYSFIEFITSVSFSKTPSFMDLFHITVLKDVHAKFILFYFKSDIVTVVSLDELKRLYTVFIEHVYSYPLS